MPTAARSKRARDVRPDDGRFPRSPDPGVLQHQRPDRAALMSAPPNDGSDTHELARRLYVSEHTVQEHLKSIFAKSGANNRRVLVAHATGYASPTTGG